MSGRGMLASVCAAGMALATLLAIPFQQLVTQSQELVRRLNDIDRGLAQRPGDAGLLRLKVDTYRQAGLIEHALTVCQAARSANLCDQPLIASLESARNAAATAEATLRNQGPRVFAVVIGISNYQKNRMPSVPHAAADALAFAKHLQTARAGAASPTNLFVLTDRNATVKRIRDALETALTKAGPRDAVYLFASAHGVTETATTEGFLMAYDSDPQDLRTTAYPLSELKALVRRRSPDISQTLLYADLCRTGPFHNHPNLIQTTLQQELEISGVRFAAILAGSSTQPTLETGLAGGHGVFSYVLLQGLGGAADRDGDGAITMDELFPYVRSGVISETKNKQRPFRFGAIPAQARIAGLRPWLYRNRWSHPAVLAFGFAQEPASQPATPPEAGAMQPGLAFDVASGPEDEGQQVILDYLLGNEIPLSKEAFERGAEWFRLAREIKPSNRVIAREEFCRGRSATFDGHYDEAIRLLSDAIRLEPEPAYAYNALGIAQLLAGKGEAAVSSFGEAIQRAPFWAYPRHNLALARAERGEFVGAERAFLEAIQVGPQRAHLHYSLGLLYQRLGRLKDAEREYRAALALREDEPEAHTGLGAVLAARGKRKNAKVEYDRALQLNPKLLSARHDLATLTWKTDPAAAIGYWEENLHRDPNFAPSQLSLARVLRRMPGRLDDSARHYAELLKSRPNLIAARVEFAEVLERLGRRPESLAEMELAAKAAPGNSPIREEFADLLSSTDAPRAEAEYRAALSLATDRRARKRISAKLESFNKR